MKIIKQIELFLISYLLLAFFFADYSIAARATYRGNWNNTTFGSSGGASFIVDDTAGEITIDLDGFVFGGSDPDPVVLDIPSIQPPFEVNVTDPFYGTITGTVDAEGLVDIAGSQLPNPGTGSMIDHYNVLGTVGQETGFQINYTVWFIGFNPIEPLEGVDYAVGTVTAPLINITGRGISQGPLLLLRE